MQTRMNGFVLSLPVVTLNSCGSWGVFPTRDGGVCVGRERARKVRGKRCVAFGSMCNQYRTIPGDVAASYFGVDAPTEAYKPGLGPKGRGPYVRAQRESSQPVAVVGLWALLADSCSTPVPKGMTNNAGVEGLDKLPSFKGPWRRGQRCLIPAASYAEPSYERADELGKSVWWDFSRADGEPIALAGLYNEWLDPTPGVLHPSYTIITINANNHPLMSRMHKPEMDDQGRPLPLAQQDKRSVVPILRDHWQRWLFGNVEDASSMLNLPREEWYDAKPRSSGR
jgi:putative SOS response-associated peptidase YedK